ncbi:MAG TPA: protein kinase [Candidatus Sulfomarinibacteraceae bacterium]|nr:protein kinase [Candidatus Sulfomarinibacteraceae bacterium]
MEGQQISHYEILEPLGRGGMGVVYRARDLKLGRTVALKFLPADTGESDQARQRFLREAQAASALDNPRICTIYEIGETDDGRPFISMACCEGETLRDRLARGPLAFDEARAVAVQVAEGLAAAHDAGIVHRDIKPANIMLTPGGVRILDFGLAKLSDATHLTRTGAAMGTPAYMSPEQATGGEVDARTDLWSLAAVLYEMVTGRRPFDGDNSTAIMFAILTADPTPAEELRSEVPDDLARVIRRGLARDPADRYPGARELLADLGAQLSAIGDPRSTTFDVSVTVATGSSGGRGRPAARASHGRRWIVAAGLATAAAVAVVGWWSLAGRGGGAGSVAADGVPDSAGAPLQVVGVLPFANRTGEAGLEWVGGGLAQLVTDGLASSRLLQVVGADRVAEAGDPAAAAAQLGLTAVVSGEILPGSDGFTVAARVVDPATGRTLAAGRQDALAAGDLLRCADSLVAEVRRGLGLPPSERVDVHTADFVADNPEAYASYLEGLRAFVDWRYDDAERAFREAVALAPSYAMARYRLATVYAATGRTDEALAEIGRAADAADRLTDREARYIRANQAYFERRFDDALAGFRDLVERYPYDTDARHLLAGLLHETGRYREELDELEVLARLSPDDSVVHSMAGYAHLALGDYTNAILELQRCVELDPDSANNHHSLAEVFQAQGELELAAAELERALAIDPDFPLAATSLGLVRALEGEWSEAETRFRTLVEDGDALPRTRIDAAFELAAILRSRGRFREAAAVLEELAPVIEAEGVREAMALAVRGTSLMELGEIRSARRLIDRAIERSPGVPTRYLFARGLLELREGRLDAARATAAEIAGHALPADDPDRTEDKAAAYLRGTAALAEGDPAGAIDALSRAVALSGYDYAVYRLGLARAYLAAGRLPEAMAAARQAAAPGDPADPRLDLELDRVRAGLVLAEVERAMGRAPKAAAHAERFLAAWKEADPGLPEHAEAERLAGGAG